MPTTVDKYLEGCQKIVDAKPKYKLGASDLNECDCIGMDKYAFRQAGVSLATSGTNYSARKQVKNLRPLVGTGDLSVGDVVFKANPPGSPKNELPARYKQGGKDYNGDLNDYYHIGTVGSVYPLKILHMTSPTSKIDTSIKNWGYVAEWKENYIRPEIKPEPEPEPEPTPEPEPEPTPTPDTAVVWSENGKPVNLRKRPSRAAALVDRVPCGDTVTLIAPDAEWCLVQWKNKTGYMMTEFLIMPEETLYMVEIPHLTYDQAEALKAMYPGAEAFEERG